MIKIEEEEITELKSSLLTEINKNSLHPLRQKVSKIETLKLRSIITDEIKEIIITDEDVYELSKIDLHLKLPKMIEFERNENVDNTPDKVPVRVRSIQEILIPSNKSKSVNMNIDEVEKKKVQERCLIVLIP